MERRLYKCPSCGEWFNTTTEIMVKHHMIKHSNLRRDITINLRASTEGFVSALLQLVEAMAALNRGPRAAVRETFH